MSLITFDDVLARYPRIADVGSSANVEPAWVSPAIAEVEGRLGTGFTVPFSSNNITASDLCIDMTYCRLMESRGDKIAEVLRKRLEARMKNLLNGTESMVTSDGSRLAAGSSVPWSNTEGYDPVFGMGNIIDSVVDSSQIYDEEQAKL